MQSDTEHKRMRAYAREGSVALSQTITALRGKGTKRYCDAADDALSQTYAGGVNTARQGRVLNRCKMRESAAGGLSQVTRQTVAWGGARNAKHVQATSGAHVSLTDGLVSPNLKARIGTRCVPLELVS